MNQVLWALDNELSPALFERLCVDLLFRAGHKDIVPIEPQDGGRDAQETPVAGRGQLGEVCFFQFSMEKDWKRKVRRDMDRVAARGVAPSSFVFVTTRKARGVDVDTLVQEAQKQYGWKLSVYSREWLRLQLEEAHPDLATKYLGTPSPESNARLVTPYPGATITDHARARDAFESGNYERAAVEFKELLRTDESLAPAWESLAWCQYQLARYDEAIASIARAIEIEPTLHALEIRGCILAERGVNLNDRASLLEAKWLFLKVAGEETTGTWTTPYNLGNVFSALGQHDVAIANYLHASELDPSIPDVWKNLASSYHRVGNHDEEMRCLNRALALEPLKPEALVSKGVSLLVDFGEAQDAADLLEQALAVDADLPLRWPHIWYWLAEARAESKDYEMALGWVDKGLARDPGNAGLRSKKAAILAELAEQDASFAKVATQFWESSLELEPRDFATRARLVRAKQRAENESAAWRILDESFLVVGLEDVVSVAESGFSIDECLLALDFLPLYSELRRVRSIDVYWKRDDPLSVGARPEAGRIRARLTSHLAIPFGLAAKALQGLPMQDRRCVEDVYRTMTVLAQGVEKVFTQASRELAGYVPVDGSVDEKSQAITEIIMFLGGVALRDFSGQLGWLGTRFGIATSTIEHVLDTFDFAGLETNVVAGCLEPLNDEVGFAPKASSGGSGSRTKPPE